jgi:hypothetical protein
MQVLAQRIEQRCPRIERKRMLGPVDVKRDGRRSGCAYESSASSGEVIPAMGGPPISLPCSQQRPPAPLVV